MEQQQHPIFLQYRRDYIAKVTGYSLGYLSRMATGKGKVSPGFIARACLALRRNERELFLPESQPPR